MNIEYLKNKKQYLSKGLTVILIFLAGVMVFEVGALGFTSFRTPRKIQAALAKENEGEEAVKECVAKSLETAGKLKEKNMFVPPPPKPKPPTCSGVFGNEVIINGKRYKVGEEVGGAKIMAVSHLVPSRFM